RSRVSPQSSSTPPPPSRAAVLERARELLGAWRGEPAQHRSREEVIRLALVGGVVAAHRHALGGVFWVVAVGAGARGGRRGMPLAAIDGVEVRPELGLGETADAPFLDGVVGLVWR